MPLVSKTKLEPGIPTYLNGGGIAAMSESRKALQAKELAALKAKHEFEVSKLQAKHSQENNTPKVSK